MDIFKDIKNFGFGLMRLPMLDGEIDIEQTKQMVDEYMAAGFNYFDTSWVYMGQKSEPAAKECLVDRYPRDSFYFATKLPAFLAEDCGNKKEFRPFELKSIGMTNVPHFEELSTLAAAKAAAEVNNEKGKIKMNKVLEALGLAEGASEDEILAAVNALKEKASAAEAKATECEKAKTDAEAKCRKMECDAFLEANKAKIADVAACREVFMASPDAAKKMIGACKAVEQKPQTVLGAAKKTPEVKKDMALGTCREQMAALPPSKRAAFYEEHKAEIDAGN